MKLKWDKKYSVNVKEIDDQHKYFIGLINHMYDALEGQSVQPIVDGTLEELKFYADDHFKTEEKYLEICDFDDMEEQKAEHAKLAQKLDELLEARSETDDLYKFYFDLLNYLSDWLTDHLETLDTKFGPVLNKHGYY